MWKGWVFFQIIRRFRWKLCLRINWACAKPATQILEESAEVFVPTLCQYWLYSTHPEATKKVKPVNVENPMAPYLFYFYCPVFLMVLRVSTAGITSNINITYVEVWCNINKSLGSNTFDFRATGQRSDNVFGIPICPTWNRRMSMTINNIVLRTVIFKFL